MGDLMGDEELMRVRVYPDDWEMQHIYQAFIRVREDSRSKRGRARRGVESEFIRRLLIAGYRHLYGEFPRPVADTGPRSSLVPVGDERPDKMRQDITTKVAQTPAHGSNATGEPPHPDPDPNPRATSEGRRSTGVDITHLLKGGSGTR